MTWVLGVLGAMNFVITRLLFPITKYLIKEAIGQHPQKLGNNAHLPGDRCVAALSQNGIGSC